MRLKDKVSIITGAANGIGKATALKFGQEGARVVVCDLKQNEVDAVVDEIKGAGGQAMGAVVNVTKDADIKAAVDAVVKAWGRVDVLVNNAGITMDSTMKKMTEEQWDRVIDINLKGVWRCTKAVTDIMLAQNSGVILTTSSVVGIYGNFGQTNYAATKFGVIGMTKTWAKELGKNNIRAVAVCPGFIGTEMVRAMPEEVIKKIESGIPMRRLGKPEEIANTFAFLASDEAGYITGVAIEASGGVVL
ncbi:MAG: beta-ketoacyl-ACP reductase [Betaproteobacteria bacterium]|nr:beta-ketoacyl-ACP reductase [Betaproteobacteria bacterium]